MLHQSNTIPMRLNSGTRHTLVLITTNAGMMCCRDRIFKPYYSRESGKKTVNGDFHQTYPALGLTLNLCELRELSLSGWDCVH